MSEKACLRQSQSEQNFASRRLRIDLTSSHENHGSSIGAYGVVLGEQPDDFKATPKSAVPVYVSHTGQDVIGNQFVDAVKKALSKSERYKVDSPNVAAHERGFQLHLDVATLEVASAGSLTEHASVASVTAEEMGLPNSWPVQVMWYHKVFLVKADRLDEIAQQFIADMDAHWCNYIKNSVGNCPKESIPPIYP